MALNILISGDCGGKILPLFKRVAAVEKSSGPFHALFCVGTFFPPSEPSEDSSDVSTELSEWIAAGEKAPVPTYFIGAYGRGSAKAMEALKGSGDCGLHYLGRSGVTDVGGLSVAFLDGTYDEAAFSADTVDEEGSCRHFRELDVAKLKMAADGAGDIDLLLTNQWPISILNGVPAPAHPKGLAVGAAPRSGCRVLDELADAMRPRYHLAAGEDIYFARPPYQNPDRGVGGHVTRFIGLAPFGNAAKQKSLHALKLVPMSKMEIATLLARPTDTTPYPFNFPTDGKACKRPPEEDIGVQTWRWEQAGGKRPRPAGKPIPGRPGVAKDAAATIYARNVPFAATEQDLEAFFSKIGQIVDIRRPGDDKGRPLGHCFVQYGSAGEAEAALQLNQQLLMGRPIGIEMAANRSSGPPAPSGKPVGSCWFCLSNPSCAVWLVASVGQEAYLALDKAPMHPQHCLIIPIEHFPSSLSLTPSARAEMLEYMAAVRRFYESKGCALVGFERFMRLRRMGGNHCHINLVPVDKERAALARGAFEEAAQGDGFSLTHLSSTDWNALRDAVGDEEFFVAFLPDGSMLYTQIGRDQKHPMDFGRRVLGQILGSPEKVHPKECMVSREEEEVLAQSFKDAFKDHDIA